VKQNKGGTLTQQKLNSRNLQMQRKQYEQSKDDVISTNEVAELQNFIAQLPYLVQKSSPILNKLFIASCLIFGVGFTVYCMGTYDYFSP
jgi:hypothetical protein